MHPKESSLKLDKKIYIDIYKLLASIYYIHINNNIGNKNILKIERNFDIIVDY